MAPFPLCTTHYLRHPITRIDDKEMDRPIEHHHIMGFDYEYERRFDNLKGIFMNKARGIPHCYKMFRKQTTISLV